MIVVDRGVEYRVYYDTSFDIYPALAKYITTFRRQAIWNDVVIIASKKATDQRLLQSKYYNDRKESWWASVHGPSCEAIAQDNIDIVLDENEKEYLEFVVKEFGSAVQAHGWYDVTEYR